MQIVHCYWHFIRFHRWIICWRIYFRVDLSHLRCFPFGDWFDWIRHKLYFHLLLKERTNWENVIWVPSDGSFRSFGKSVHHMVLGHIYDLWSHRQNYWQVIRFLTAGNVNCGSGWSCYQHHYVFRSPFG